VSIAGLGARPFSQNFHIASVKPSSQDWLKRHRDAQRTRPMERGRVPGSALI
jgi:hypothetical protein